MKPVQLPNGRFQLLHAGDAVGRLRIDRVKRSGETLYYVKSPDERRVSRYFATLGELGAWIRDVKERIDKGALEETNDMEMMR